jgi:hypothetical protein
MLATDRLDVRFRDMYELFYKLQMTSKLKGAEPDRECGEDSVVTRINRSFYSGWGSSALKCFDRIGRLQFLTAASYASWVSGCAHGCAVTRIEHSGLQES